MGMESVTLTKPWLTFTAGDTVEVDLLRALWLRENGYATAKRPAAAELEPPPVEPELQSPFPGVEIVPPPPTTPTPSPVPSVDADAVPSRAEMRRRMTGRSDRPLVEEP